jgi:ubiquinone/menaquinone biosynthesis C-methylase UbiE
MATKGKGEQKGKPTSWGGVAAWYETHLKGDDTYHAKVIAPNLMRILNPKQGMKVLDMGCGEGYFTRIIDASGAYVEGADIAKELIAKAKAASPEVVFHVAPAEKMTAAKDGYFDALVCVLALQNMEHLDAVAKEVARVLQPKGRAVFVLNHPAFRIPKVSSWGWDEKSKTQYRRIDRYLSQSRASIDMAPGKGTKHTTWSFHRSMQDYMKAFAGAGFAMTRLEEWISHKKSEKGPRAAAEDTARKEFPLFMCIELTKLV